MLMETSLLGLMRQGSDVSINFGYRQPDKILFILHVS